MSSEDQVLSRELHRHEAAVVIGLGHDLEVTELATFARRDGSFLLNGQVHAWARLVVEHHYARGRSWGDSHHPDGCVKCVKCVCACVGNMEEVR